MAVALEDIKKLRERTGAGMADCKKALEDANGNMDEAIDVLRKKGAATAAKRADKAAEEGVIATAVDESHKSGAIVEINSETDFVARNEQFVEFGNNLAEVVLKTSPENEATLLSAEMGNGTTVQQELNELLAKFSERIEIRRFVRVSTDDGFINDYVHGGSRLGVLVELNGVSDIDEEKAASLARDVAMQVAAMNPTHVRREQVKQEELEREKDIYRDQLKQEGKPAEIVEKIVNGKIEKYYEENVLLEQSFVKDSSKSISEYLGEQGEGVTVANFVRFNLGESVDEPA